jgi:hypothetical protein
MDDLTRQILWKNVDYDIDLSGYIPELIEYLNKCVENYGPDIKIVRYPNYEYSVMQRHIETDDEYNRRIAEMKKQEEKHLEKEKAEYKRLKAKFG